MIRLAAALVCCLSVATAARAGAPEMKIDATIAKPCLNDMSVKELRFKLSGMLTKIRSGKIQNAELRRYREEYRRTWAVLRSKSASPDGF